MTSASTPQRLTNIIWPALLLAMMVALAVVADGANCPSKRQIDGCGDVGCNSDVDLWSGLRLFFAPAPTAAAPTNPSDQVTPAPLSEHATFVAAASRSSLTVLHVAPKTSPPA